MSLNKEVKLVKRNALSRFHPLPKVRMLLFATLQATSSRVFNGVFYKVNNAQQTVAKVLHSDLSSIPVLVLNGQLAGLQFLLQYSLWGSNWDDIISDGLVEFDVKSHSNYYACERVKQWQEARAKAENPERVDAIYGAKELEHLKYNPTFLT